MDLDWYQSGTVREMEPLVGMTETGVKLSLSVASVTPITFELDSSVTLLAAMFPGTKVIDL